uniref:Uncharacterized protein n=1 Tax=Rhizophora mucronata TaxID=61149 RepID=A0A2P2PST5_RHIMU
MHIMLNMHLAGVAYVGTYVLFALNKKGAICICWL